MIRSSWGAALQLGENRVRRLRRLADAERRFPGKENVPVLVRHVLRALGLPEEMVAQGVHLCRRWAISMAAFAGESKDAMTLKGNWRQEQKTREYTAFSRERSRSK